MLSHPRIGSPRFQGLELMSSVDSQVLTHSMREAGVPLLGVRIYSGEQSLSVCKERQMWEGPLFLPPTLGPGAEPCAVLMAFSLISTVKKKSSAGLRLSHLMNLGRKKSTSLEPAERSLETASKQRSRLPGRSPFAGRQLSSAKAGVVGLALTVSV